MRRHLWLMVLSGLIGTLALTSDAQAWHLKKKCPPPPKCEPCASPKSEPEEPSPPPEKCPPKKPCKFQIFPTHKSCLARPEKVVEPCIVPPCPAPPPPCPPIVHLPPAPAPQETAPSTQAPSKQGS